MKIRDILAKGEPTLSFEVFPPKTEDKYESVEHAALEIGKLKPAFMSVTYGGGGRTQPLYGGYCIHSSEPGSDASGTFDLCVFHKRKGDVCFGGVKKPKN